MRLSTLTESAGDAWRSAGAYVTDLVTPTVRLGVTGLARAGKTNFITALVRNLVTGGRLPFFDAVAQGRIVRAWLEPQPDDQLPRFAYEEHLALLAKAEPEWPQSTRRISQLRVTLEFEPVSRVRRALGVRTLNLDIVDYPGEWLLDLALLEQDYTAWSAAALALARASGRAAAAAPFLAFLSPLDPAGREDEQAALIGARLFTDYLHTARAGDHALSIAGPGRFLLPGDLAGSPLLTFFPLDAGTGPAPRGSLAAMLARRYEAYRTHVVKPFYRDHFARLDRQVVLVDVLAALDAGPATVANLETALAAILRSFRPGSNSWLSGLVTRRIDRILFAASKADHLHHASHDRLEAVLRLLTDKAMTRAVGAGAEVRAMALAALRATREAEIVRGDERLPCIVGVPLAGERIGTRTFDGRAEAAVFPGDLPADPAVALAEGLGAGREMRFVRFRPPRIPALDETPTPVALPHIRLDRALDFLIGDRLQ